MHIFNLSSLFIKFLHMFALHDVISPSIVCVAFMEIALSVTPVSTEITEILNMIFSYKSYLAFFSDISYVLYILNVLIYIHISSYVSTIFVDISFHFFQYMKMHM